MNRIVVTLVALALAYSAPAAAQQNAAAAPGALEARIAASVLRAGDRTDLHASVRAGGAATPSAVVTAPGRPSIPVALRAAEVPGEFRATLVAPAVAGVHRVVISSGADRVDVPFVVAEAVMRPEPNETDLLRAWARAHGGGGGVIEMSALDELSGSLERVLQPAARTERWHPMRSVWWLVPFTLALGAEWWWRRRRGLA